MPGAMLTASAPAPRLESQPHQLAGCVSLDQSLWRRLTHHVTAARPSARSGPKQRLLPINPSESVCRTPHLCPRCACSPIPGTGHCPIPGKRGKHFALTWGWSRPVPLPTLLCSRSLFRAGHTGRIFFILPSSASEVPLINSRWRGGLASLSLQSRPWETFPTVA